MRVLSIFFICITVYSFSQEIKHIKLGTKSSGSGEITLELIARRQSYNLRPTSQNDVYETVINSPKSVIFSKSGDKFYVNSLEGHETGVFDAKTFNKTKVIRHQFDESNVGKLFLNNESSVFGYSFFGSSEIKNRNYFLGKPVESCLSHDGNYLWITYYRRSYDLNAQCPSAVAIIDTRSDEIVRVMPTGPLPKMIACSPDNRFIAVTHWGDNTVGIIDISSDDPFKFQYINHCIVDKRLEMNFGNTEKVDRDADCGFCLRGTTFSPDGKFLFVGKMGGGGGISIFDTRDFSSLGNVTGMQSNLRHIVISGEYLFLSANKPGYVQRASWRELTKFRIEHPGQSVKFENWSETYVGTGARTISLSPEGDYIFAAVNTLSKVVVVDTKSMKVVAEIAADSFPVGMSISPNGEYLVVTSQGKTDGGGNSVMIFQIKKK
ncbi:MAG: peptidoglycan-binding protein [Bacteroidetes bacterium]|nr:peptidoglycan-binding protein [Bacteroidota bacterium]